MTRKRLFPIRFFPAETSYDFMGKRWLAFGVTFLAVVVSIILIATKGLNFGIDFTGGSVIEARLAEKPDLAKIRDALSHQELGEVALQAFGTGNDILIRLQRQKGGEAEQMKAVETVKQILAETAPGQIEYRKVDFVGPQVGEELLRGGILALVLSFVGIMFYLWFRFEWQFGLGAVIALLHDAMIILGFYAFTGIEFNLTSVAALLTIIGYSVNDSVVIYDRIRENMRKFKKMPMAELINLSINETLSRTILTVSTTLVAVLALVLVGGDVLHGFSLAMLFGIIVGTYSSIYISAPVLIYFNIRPDRATALVAKTA